MERKIVSIQIRYEVRPITYIAVDNFGDVWVAKRGAEEWVKEELPPLPKK